MSQLDDEAGEQFEYNALKHTRCLCFLIEASKSPYQLLIDVDGEVGVALNIDEETVCEHFSEPATDCPGVWYLNHGTWQGGSLINLLIIRQEGSGA